MFFKVLSALDTLFQIFATTLRSSCVKPIVQMGRSKHREVKRLTLSSLVRGTMSLQDCRARTPKSLRAERTEAWMGKKHGKVARWDGQFLVLQKQQYLHLRGLIIPLCLVVWMGGSGADR